MRKFSKLILLIALLALPTTAHANGDLSLNSSNIRFSHSNFLEGNTVRIYATVQNNSNNDLLGLVRFFDNGSQIGADQPVSTFSGGTDDIFVDWTPWTYGSHNITIQLYPWEEAEDNSGNNIAVKDVYILPDTDRDGISNDKDDDDDGDGINDQEDHFPLDFEEQYDTDGDGTGNNADLDDDNDGVPDEKDDVPLDPNETIDTDEDGVGNVADKDDDNDGLSDAEEENLKTNALDPDTDGDNVLDGEDAFPLDPNESQDTDGDKIGNNTDKDDDNDGVNDENDEFPLNKGPIIDLGDEKFIVSLFEEKLFDASKSYDEDGKIVSFLWEIDGQEFEGNSLKKQFNQTGDYNVKLTLKDNTGESRTQEFQVNVVNSKLHTQIALTLLTILLAIAIYIKYIAEAKNSKKSTK